MGQTASQIENHIEDQRSDLSSNLQELGNKVKSATDWRYQYRNKPMIFLCAAFGGGALLAAMTNGHSGRERQPYYKAESGSGTYRSPAAREPSPAMNRAMQAWEDIKGALVGIAAARVKEYADGFIPGFAEQYDKTQRTHGG